jgi:2-iminobutanoate/2-iminopropanoate deaminase
MAATSHNPSALFPPYRCYAHAVEVSAGARTLYISGLNGFEVDGKTMPESFEEQAELIWQHIHAVLASAGMSAINLVSLRTYLADPSYDEANVLMRVKHLGSHRVASTVVCSKLLDPRWKLEVEAVAATCVQSHAGA